MSDKHLDPKDLKKPDAFQVQGFKTLSWIETNAKLLIVIILPFPIVF
jgi:hypothetical protein